LEGLEGVLRRARKKAMARVGDREEYVAQPKLTIEEHF